MRISAQWLNEFVTTPPVEELAHVLEMAGAGVENLQDDVFTLEVTSNRGDWLSAIGLAREIAAMTDKRLRVPKIDFDYNEYSQEPVTIEIENGEECTRYIACVIENMQVGPSPDWMQERLTQCGMRPINNIVDITNYVMLETGQPLHAFDADKIAGNTVVVRRARNGESLRTLDGVDRELSEQVLVIADREKPIGLAGLMGGEDSEVGEGTTRILLESAHFAGQRVRRGARSLGLTSEASRRFERWVDPNGARRAAVRAASLLQQHAGGQTVSLLDRVQGDVAPAQVKLRIARCNALLGLKLSSALVTKLLERLGFTVAFDAEGVLDVTVPTFRRDISREADLIEEVARIHGYDQIPTTLPRTVNAMAGRSLSQRLEERAKSALLRCGLSEVITLSMQNEAASTRADLGGVPAVRLRNPLSEDFTQLRTSLLPSLLEVLGKNARRGARIFELGKVYLPQEKKPLPLESRYLTLALLAPATPPLHWQKNQQTIDFFTIKAVVETLFSEVGAPRPIWRVANQAPFHPGRCAALSIDSQDLGIVGEVHPDVAARYDLPTRAYLATIDFDSLVRHISLLRKFEPINRFPAVERDLALVLSRDVAASQVERTLRSAGGELLRNVCTFDVYTGAPIPEGSKSIALSLRFQAPDRTLVDAEIDELMTQIRASAERELSAQLR